MNITMDNGSLDRTVCPEVSLGDIVVFEAAPRGSEKRMGLVVGIDDTWSILRIHLVSVETEFATDLDLVTRAEEVGFELLIEGEVYGPILSEQVTATIASLPSSIAEAITQSVITDGQSVEEMTSAIPLLGRHDVRRAFKQDELVDLDDYTRAARAWLSDGPSLAASINLDWLESTNTAFDATESRLRAAYALASIRSLRQADRRQAAEILEVLEQDGSLENLGSWRATLGCDVVRELSRLPLTDGLHGKGPSSLISDQSISLNELMFRQLATSGILTLDLFSAGPSQTSDLLFNYAEEGMNRPIRIRVLTEAGAR